MERYPDLPPKHLQPINKDGNENKNVFNQFIEELGLNRYTKHKLTPSDVLSINQEVLSDATCRSIKDITWRFLRWLISLNTNANNSMFCGSEMDRRSIPSISGQGKSVTRSETPIDISMYLSKANESYNLSDSIYLRDSENEWPTVHPLDVLCALLNCADNFLRQEIVTRLSMSQFAVPLLLPAGDGMEGMFMLWAMRNIVKYLPTETGEFVEDYLVNIPMPLFSFVRLGECKNISKSQILNQVLSLISHSCRTDFVHREMNCGKGSRIISNGLVELAWYLPTKNTGPCCAQQPFAIANLHGDIQANLRQFRFLANVSSAVFILLEGASVWGEIYNEECDHFYFIVGHPSNSSMNYETEQLCKALSSSLSNLNILLGIEKNLEEKIQLVIQNAIEVNPNQMTLTDMAALGSAFGFSIDENQRDCQYAKLHTLELTHDISTTAKYNENYLKSLKEIRIQLTKVQNEKNQPEQQGKSNKEHFKSELADHMLKSLLRCLWNDDITNLVYAFTFMSRAQKQYFLKWMQVHRHKASTNTLLEEAMQRNIFYDLVHIYQAEAIVSKATGHVPRCSELPKTAADLLLDGFPLVFIGEDTFSVHLPWITDVLTDLVNKTRGQCRVRVISALGVYCTGKSSLLYTMFGLQFQVTRPQPTKGALMSLIKVEDSFKQKLDCDFLLVIDTEGLRASKLASEKEKFEHDNALAAFMIGMSDIVIFSLSGENPLDTINIFQMATCALLRMRDSGRRPALYFVQTDATNGSSDGENSNKDKIHQCLHETIDLAAKVVKRASFLSLKDVFECDFLSRHWYSFIPSLWQGDPFNRCINSEYAEKVMELKKHLIHTLTQKPNHGSLRTMLDFIDDIKSLWNAVNLEPILKYERIKEVITYTELSDRYRELERGIHKELYEWSSKEEAQISPSHGADFLKEDMLEHLQKKKQEKFEHFRLYLDSDKKQFEECFIEKFHLLSKELETFYKKKCTEIQILRHGLQMAVIEDLRDQEWDPDELEPNLDFDSFWEDKVSQLKLQFLEKLDIQNEFLQILKKEMRDRGGLVTEVLNSVNNLSDSMEESFTIEEKHIDATWLTRKGAKNNNGTKPWSRLERLVESLTKRCSKYALTMTKLNKDYEPIHCLEMLRMINKVIRKEIFPFTDMFEVDLKLHILRRTAEAFQKTHEALVKAKEENFFLEQQRAPPLNSLKNIIQDKCSAKRFCHLCLKPAMELHMTSTLQPYVIRDNVGAVRKSRRTSPILDVIRGFPLFNNNSQVYIDCNLLADAISSTMAILKRVLQRHTEMEYDNVNVLMGDVCIALASELSLKQRDIAEYPLEVTSLTPHQFSSHVDFFIRQLKNELQPNRDTFRIMILRVCKKLFECRKQNQYCKDPYNSGFRSHQKNFRTFCKRSKPSKIKTVGPHSWPKESSAQRVHININVNESHPQQFANWSKNRVWWRGNKERAYFEDKTNYDTVITACNTTGCHWRATHI
ncbi:up-regulator of cell proliferation-like [Rana temporaria]|uniref:up-regulator of cell proliferation-like n=1 Tax=Rana temporaria TaxID=8407 RepID=UPI001AAE083C|nr:up-regulator of cell proliferation-like [Rana temporaria]